MKLLSNEFFWLAIFLSCLAGFYVTKADWLVGLAFVPAAPFMWLSIKHQWNRKHG